MRIATMLATCIVFCLVNYVVATGPKLNVPHVLLPYVRGEPLPQFKLVVSNVERDACFKWNSTQPKLVSVRPESSCSLSAIVSSSSSLWSSSLPERVHALITAERVDAPSEILRANVILGVIDSLSIITHTHRLYLEEAPEEFIVRARDKEGNQFSTLKGINFTWSIGNGDGAKKGRRNGEQNNVRFMDPEKSQYYFLEHQSNDLEETRGPFGTRVLLEGTRAGLAEVSVRIDASRQIGQAPPASVSVRVLANVALLPSLARLIPGARLGFVAEEIKNGKTYNIELTSSQHYSIKVVNDQVAKVSDGDRAVVFASDYGRAEVVLIDNSVDQNMEHDDVVMPTSVLYVVRPHTLILGIGPVSNWHVTVNRDCYVYVDIFDVENNPIVASDNLEITFDFNPDDFEREPSQEPHVVSGRPIRSGTIKVVAKLLGVVNGAQLETPLIATAYMNVYDEIRVDPPVAVMAWRPSKTGSSQSMSFAAIGGSGKFQWFSSNPDVATIDKQTGQSRSLATYLGSTTITASMVDAPHNSGLALLKVLPVTKLELCSDTRLEAEVGQLLYLPLVMWAKDDSNNLVLVDECKDLPLQVNIDNSDIFDLVNIRQQQPEEFLENGDCRKACSVLTLRAKKQGFTSVNVEVTYPSSDLSSPRSGVLTIGAYEALRVVQPEEGPLVLGIDSSLQVVWTGGPLMWPVGPQSNYRERVDTETKTNLDVARIRTGLDSMFKVFQVTCKKETENIITLSVGNEASSKLRHPVVLQSEVVVSCQQPQQLKLKPRPKMPSDTTKPCPINAGDTASILPVSAVSDLIVDLYVFDGENRLFHNFSAEHIKLGVSKSDLAAWKSESKLQFEERNFDGRGEKNFLVPRQAIQVLSPKSKEGIITIFAKLQSESLLRLSSSTTIESSINLQLVFEMRLETSALALLLHPKVSESVTVERGSGYFELSSSSATAAAITYDSKTRRINIKPEAEGQMTANLRDLCIASKGEELTVTVSKIEGAKVELEHRSVQKGDFTKARVVLMNKMGQTLSVNNSFVTSQLTSPNSDIVSITRLDDSRNLFKVRGLLKGEALLVGTIDYTPKEVLKSTPATLQVYNSLRLEPRNITLMKGASFQVEVAQGPIDDRIKFTLLNNKNVVEVNNEGLITGLIPGSTTLIAKSYSSDVNENRLLSTDSVNVHVVVFKGLKINVPVKEIEVGSTIPLQLVGLEDSLNQNLFAFGTTLPALKINWNLSPVVHSDIATLDYPLHNCQHSDGEHNDHSNDNVRRLTAKRPGRVTVRVEAKFTANNQFLSQGAKMSDEIEITILDPLSLKKPSLEARPSTLLLTPNAKLQLETNSIDTFRVISVNNSETSNLVDVSKRGLVSSKGLTGYSVVIVEREDEKFGFRQRLVFNVEVRNIAYVMTHVHCENSVTSSTNNVLALGASFGLKLSYHDQWGHEFDAVSSSFHTAIRPSRFDSIRVMNSSNKFATTAETTTVIRASATNKAGRFEDFVTLHIKQAPLLQTQRMTRGQVIRLSNAAITRNHDKEEKCDTDMGEWQVHPEDLAQVINGFIVSLRPGSGHVVLAKDKDKVVNELVVIESSHISIDWPTTKRSSYYGNAKHMLIPFHVSPIDSTAITAGGETSDALETILQHLYKCSVQWADDNNTEDSMQTLFNVKPVFDSKVNSLGCLLTLEKPVQVMKLLRLSVEMRDNNVTSQTTIQFRGPLTLSDDKRQLEFTTKDVTYNIGVVGSSEVLKDLSVEISNGARFLTATKNWPRNRNSSRALFSFQLDKAIFDNDLFDPNPKPQVKLVAPLTGEEIDFNVKIVMDRLQKPRKDESDWTTYLQPVGWSLLAAVIGIVYGLKDKFRGQMSAPSAHRQATPLRRSPESFLNGSNQSFSRDLISLDSPRTDHSWLNSGNSPTLFSNDDHATSPARSPNRSGSSMRNLTNRPQ